MVYYSIKQVIKYIVGTKWSSFYKKYVKDKYSKLLTVITAEIIYIVYKFSFDCLYFLRCIINMFCFLMSKQKRHHGCVLGEGAVKWKTKDGNIHFAFLLVMSKSVAVCSVLLSKLKPRPMTKPYEGQRRPGAKLVVLGAWLQCKNCWTPIKFWFP